MTLQSSDSNQHYDHNTLVEIYEKHSAELYRYAYRLTGDPAVAEECVSETFDRFLHGLRKNNQPLQNVRAYLYRITHNSAVDYLRSTRPQINLQHVERIADQQSNPSRIITANLDREQIRNALQQLTPEQQMVIQLRFLEEWSHDEVAELLGKTSEASRALQYRALAALRELLEREDYEQQPRP